MLMLAIPFAFLSLASLFLGLIPGILLGLAIVVLSSAFFGTFASSMWTLGFMRMTGYAVGQSVTVADSTPPAA